MDANFADAIALVRAFERKDHDGMLATLETFDNAGLKQLALRLSALTAFAVKARARDGIEEWAESMSEVTRDA